MPALTAQLLGSTPPEPVLITVTGLPTDGTVSVTVYREVAGAEPAVVHGFDAVIPVAAVLQAPDVTAPMGRPIVYVLSVTTLATGVPVDTSAGPVTVTDAGRHVLSSPWSPAVAPVDLLLTPDERVAPARTYAFAPAGRSTSVLIYDVRGAESGTLDFYTRTAAETTAVRALLDAQAVIVSRHPADGCDVPGVELLGLGDVTSRRRSSTLGDRIWTVPAQTVDDPDPLRRVVLVSQADVAAFYLGRTQADKAADFATQLDLSRDDFGAL